MKPYICGVQPYASQLVIREHPSGGFTVDAMIDRPGGTEVKTVGAYSNAHDLMDDLAIMLEVE